MLYLQRNGLTYENETTRKYQSSKYWKKEYISSRVMYIQTSYEPVDLATHTPELGSVYRIGVNLGAVQVISDESIRQNPQIVDYYKHAAARSVAEEVYGEIRKELMDTVVERVQRACITTTQL